ncbi:GbcA Glycine betaine demethylase subunit A [Pseudomonas chlororaphis]|nr:GbcA Glycine betaine demethylase subunit A [Pseudomonas chlororaphis]
MRRPINTHLPIRDIHMLIATSPQPPGLARREQIGPCRPWIRFRAAPAPHSPQHKQLLYTLRCNPDQPLSRPRRWP